MFVLQLGARRQMTIAKSVLMLFTMGGRLLRGGLIGGSIMGIMVLCLGGGRRGGVIGFLLRGIGCGLGMRSGLRGFWVFHPCDSIESWVGL